MNKRKHHELALLATDAYKFFHVNAYPEGATNVYSNMTPRANSYFKYSDMFVSFGTEMFVERFLIDYWNSHFFDLTIEEVIEDFNTVIIGGGLTNGLTENHIRELHELGYLPVEIKSLPEGHSFKVGTPLLTVENTDDRFYWLPNFLETQILSEVYPVMNAATTAKEYKKVALKWSEKTSDNNDHIPWQFHDFSRRGHHANDAGMTIATGHLTSFMGSDSVQGSLLIDNYYEGNTLGGNVYGSVSATEHSVSSSYGLDGEFEYYESLIKKFPTGILSMVSDTYDYWNVLNNFLPQLKEDIMKRDGSLIIRPDSGYIIDVICGNKDKYEEGTAEYKGSLQLLWETFGGTINSKGYKVLDPHIGLIYGDSVNLDNVNEIFKRMEEIGFASSNVVLGVGALSYNVNNTRDTFACAFKTTSVIINGEERHVQKDPKTDHKKKSAKGRLAVIKTEDGTELIEGLYKNPLRFKQDMLETIFKNGQRTRHTPFTEIKQRIEDDVIEFNK